MILGRMIPRRLFGQMVLLLGAAIVVAKVGSWLASEDERHYAVRRMHIEDTLARTVSAVRLLSATPPELHPYVLEAASSLDFRFKIVSSAEVPQTNITSEEAEIARSRLASLLGGVVQDIRVMISRPDQSITNPIEPGSSELALKMAVHLPDGQWLKATTLQVLRPPGWGWFATGSTFATVLVIALCAFFIARRVAGPLQELARAAERLGRGETGPPLAENLGPEEVRRTARAFNAMDTRIRRFVEDRTRMLAAVSHDLRTPITSLRLRVELLDDGEAKSRMCETLDELAQTAEAALAFTRDEAGEQCRAVDLAALVESVCSDMDDIGHPVECSAGERLPVSCRPASLRRAIRNLVENAVFYGGKAHITVSRGMGEVRITVQDDGPGIPEDKLDSVFNAFVRLETSRNRRTGGVGLGLSIARSVARAHGGDILLENRKEGGLRATIALPVEGVTPDDPVSSTRVGVARRFMHKDSPTVPAPGTASQHL
jgi:signal transduction histidine kinase